MSKTNHKLKEFVGATIGRPNFEGTSKKEKGITLIALIITIVVMLILVAVTLDITLGENGLVNKAKTASEATTKEVDRELLLSAVVGAMDNNGTVNFGILDGSLPEGFTGSNGTYTSKNGNTFTVNTNGEIISSNNSTNDGEEITTVDLNGKYYYYDDVGNENSYVEIENHNKWKAFSYDSSSDESNVLESNIEITIDEENKTANIFNVEFEENIVFFYELIKEDNQVVNKILIPSSDDDGMWFFQNLKGIDFPLDGMYISQDGEHTLEFDPESVYVTYRRDDNSSIGMACARVNGIYYISGYDETLTVSDDFNTVIYNGITFTKESNL